MKNKFLFHGRAGYQKSRGVTAIVALFVIILVVAVIAGISLLNSSLLAATDFQKRARDSSVKDSLSTYRIALAMELAEYGKYPDSLAEIILIGEEEKSAANANFNPSGSSPSYTLTGSNWYTLTATGWLGSYTATPTGITGP
jgi:hypothetical protein